VNTIVEIATSTVPWDRTYLLIFRAKNSIRPIKQVFPSLLAKLLEKDYSNSIRSGFECTGIFPVNVERALSRLPDEDPEVETHVQQQLLNKLHEMRFNPGPTTHAKRPAKKDKLPPGASYTCTAEGGRVGLLVGSGDAENAVNNSDESSSDEEQSKVIRNIIKRISSKKPRLEDPELEEESEEEKTEEDESEEDESGGDQPELDMPDTADVDETLDAAAALPDYPPEVFVVAIYQGDWYVGQVLKKDGEPEADLDDSYVFISFMERAQGDLLKWPQRSDMLNTHKDDVLFVCEPPIPSASSSSSRSTTFALSKSDLNKAKQMFMLAKAYYLTKSSLVLGVLFCPCCLVLAVLSLLSCPCCLAHAVSTLLSCPCFLVLAVTLYHACVSAILYLQYGKV
jgi:hypothetical protein